MKIIDVGLKFARPLTWGNNPNVGILHHAEWSICSLEDIHRCHIYDKGWSGIGYHYFVRKNGQIFKGRPDGAQGAHCLGHNRNTIGICAEGAYNKETMPEVQKQAIIDLCIYLKNTKGIKTFKGHKEFMSTDCPGKNYPLQEIKNKINGGSSSTSTLVQTSSSSSGKKTWEYHIHGSLVSRLQHELNSQFSKGLKEDGWFGDLVINALITVHPGAKGNMTKIIQERLIALGYGVGQWGADGVFGQSTVEAVECFQKSKGLCVDGIVGRNTWDYLFRI